MTWFTRIILYAPALIAFIGGALVIIFSLFSTPYSKYVLMLSGFVGIIAGLFSFIIMGTYFSPVMAYAEAKQSKGTLGFIEQTDKKMKLIELQKTAVGAYNAGKYGTFIGDEMSVRIFGNIPLFYLHETHSLSPPLEIVEFYKKLSDAGYTPEDNPIEILGKTRKIPGVELSSVEIENFLRYRHKTMSPNTVNSVIEQEKSRQARLNQDPLGNLKQIILLGLLIIAAMVLGYMIINTQGPQAAVQAVQGTNIP